MAGATIAQVDDNLIACRQAKLDACASFSQRNTIQRDLAVVEDKINPLHSINDALALSGPQKPSDARAYPDDSFRGAVARATGSTNVDTAYNQSKKGYAVHSYFKDRQFTCAPEQLIETFLRDYEICAEQQCLETVQVSLFILQRARRPRLPVLPHQ